MSGVLVDEYSDYELLGCDTWQSYVATDFVMQQFLNFQCGPSVWRQLVLLVRVELCQTTRRQIPETVIAKVDEELEKCPNVWLVRDEACNLKTEDVITCCLIRAIARW